MTNKPHDSYCINESRIATLEAQVKNKRYDINDLEDDLTEQANCLTKLTNEVTRLATIMSENQTSRKEHGEKIDKLEVQVTQLNSTLNTLKWIITVFIALFGGVVVFLITQLIQMIH